MERLPVSCCFKVWTWEDGTWASSDEDYMENRECK